MKFFIKRTGPDTFTTASHVDLEQCDTLPYGEELQVDIKRIRNVKFHKKWMSLLRFAYQYFDPMPLGDKVPKKDFDTFREWVVTRCGHFDVVGYPDGSSGIKARSISFASMDEDTFKILYSDTINILMDTLEQYGFNEDELQKCVEHVLMYDS